MHIALLRESIALLRIDFAKPWVKIALRRDDIAKPWVKIALRRNDIAKPWVKIALRQMGFASSVDSLVLTRKAIAIPDNIVPPTETLK